MNNPLSHVDPTGLDCVTANEDGSATVTSGDCPNNDPNNEYYYDCDGCLMSATSVGVDQAGGLYFDIGSQDGVSVFAYISVDYTAAASLDSGMPDASQPGVAPGSTPPTGPPGSGGGGAPNNAKQVWACRADVALQYAVGFLPFANAVKLGLTVSGVNFNIFQNAVSGKNLVTFDNPFTGMGNVKGMFWGTNALASTYSTIMQSAAKIGPGAVLDDVAKAAGTAGTIANLVNTASAVNDLVGCGTVH